MSLACLIGKHRVRPTATRNQGLYFSRCARCERDMVRSLASWRAVPRGFRVVWRQAGWQGPVAANLPVPVYSKAGLNDERIAARLAALLALAGAGLRAVLWSLSDRLEGLARLKFAPRRPALLRLPAP
jgi:hypothetical protein